MCDAVYLDAVYFGMLCMRMLSTDAAGMLCEMLRQGM